MAGMVRVAKQNAHTSNSMIIQLLLLAISSASAKFLH
jgi:hypothetical protein